jgi:hypothetical protein
MSKDNLDILASALEPLPPTASKKQLTPITNKTVEAKQKAKNHTLRESSAAKIVMGNLRDQCPKWLYGIINELISLAKARFSYFQLASILNLVSNRKFNDLPIHFWNTGVAET